MLAFRFVARGLGSRVKLGCLLVVSVAACARSLDDVAMLDDLPRPTGGDGPATTGPSTTAGAPSDGGRGAPPVDEGDATSGNDTDAEADASVEETDASDASRDASPDAAPDGTSGGTTSGTSAGTTSGTTSGTSAGTTSGTNAGTTSGTTSGTSAGTTSGTTSGTSAGTTSGTTSGAPSCSKPTGGRCGLAPQCGCGTGQTCIPTGYTSPSTACITAGLVEAGGGCAASGDCKRGLACIERVCRSFCSDTVPCPGNREGPACVPLEIDPPLSGGAKACSLRCVLDSTSSCGSQGAGCTEQGGATDCRRMGSKGQGEVCQQDMDCSPGYACVSDTRSGSKHCGRWCRVNADCGGGVCNKTYRVATIDGVSYGTCRQ